MLIAVNAIYPWCHVLMLVWCRDARCAGGAHDGNASPITPPYIPHPTYLQPSSSLDGVVPLLL